MNDPSKPGRDNGRPPLTPGRELETPGRELEREARKQPISLLGEFGYLVRHERKWWLIPLLLSIAVIGFAVMLTSATVAPFIYTLF